jgi:hypothetical protein
MTLLRNRWLERTGRAHRSAGRFEARREQPWSAALSASIKTMSSIGWLSWIAATTNTSGITHHGATGLGSSLQMAGLKPSAACCRVANATQASRQIAAHKNEALLCFYPG